MVYFKSKENITKENFNDFDKVQKNVNKFISETTHDSYSGCIIVDINNRKLIQQWGDYDDCKKQALKDKFMISDLEEDLHLRNKHTSPSTATGPAKQASSEPRGRQKPLEGSVMDCQGQN